MIVQPCANMSHVVFAPTTYEDRTITQNIVIPEDSRLTLYGDTRLSQGADIYNFGVLDGSGTLILESGSEILGSGENNYSGTRVDPLSVDLSGPSTLDSGENGTWTASVTGGSGSTSYDWEYQSPGSDTWKSASCSGSDCTRSFSNNDVGPRGERLYAGLKRTYTGADEHGLYVRDLTR